MADYIVVHGIRIAKDFVPETFGRLTTIGPVFRAKAKLARARFQVVRCVCGNVLAVNRSNLVNGTTKSCGCLNVELAAARKFKHGECTSAEYTVWTNLRLRCRYKGANGYANYGGRGIRVCDRWNDFALFLADVGPRPSDKHSIDRIDVNGHYEPGNCRWATKVEQCNNRRSNIMLEIDGVTKSATEWARQYGVKPAMVRKRLGLGWTAMDALTIPVRTMRTK